MQVIAPCPGAAVIGMRISFAILRRFWPVPARSTSSFAPLSRGLLYDRRRVFVMSLALIGSSAVHKFMHKNQLWAFCKNISMI